MTKINRFISKFFSGIFLTSSLIFLLIFSLTFFLSSCSSLLFLTSQLVTATGSDSGGQNPTVVGTPAPDLVVQGFTLNASTNALTVGITEWVDLAVTVLNLGEVDSLPGVVKYYRSVDASISTNDSEIGRDSFTNLGASETVSETMTLPISSVGESYYGACIEVQTGESDTANNCSPAVLLTVLAPDLTAIDFQVNDNTGTASVNNTGGNIVLSVTVQNNTVVASPAGVVKYYRSADHIIATNDTEVGSDDFAELAATGTSGSTSDEAIIIPSLTGAGTYYYGACVGDKCSVAVAVNVLASDLAVTDFQVNGGTRTVSLDNTGVNLDLSVVVTNQGAGTSPAGVVRYYRSADHIIDPTQDTEVGSDNFAGLAGAGSSAGISEQSLTLTALTAPGTYYYGACVGSECSSAVRVGILAGDLMLIDFQVNDSIGPVSVDNTGVNLGLSLTLTNEGAGSVSAGVVRYYRSADASITTADTEVESDSFNRLAASQGANQRENLTAPTTPGTYYYGACVGDECSPAVRVDVLAPDLTAIDFLINGTNAVSLDNTGINLDLSVRVLNRGAGSSSAGVVSYYRSADASISTEDTEVGSDNFSQLAAAGASGASSDQNLILTAPTTSGTYYYGACVEVLSGESDTANNCSAAVRVNVTSDLTVSNFEVENITATPGVTNIGRSVNLSVVVTNQGAGISSAGVVKYYRSADANITISDTELGLTNFSGLAAGGSPGGAFSEARTVPTPTTAGTYYYGACVEVQRHESNTANNCSPGVSVYIAPAGTRLASQDFDTLSTVGNNFPISIWSDGSTMWVIDYRHLKIYAYDLTTKNRIISKEFNTISGSGNNDIRGIWSDGSTMWVADFFDGKIYAYNLATKDRDISKDFNTLAAASNDRATGIWSDGTTMWVADWLDDKIYAYKMSDKTRTPSKDFDTLATAGNNDIRGIWSDGTTMWVTDIVDDKIYAYKMSDKSRDPGKDFDTLAAAGDKVPNGLWSDGEIMWVADESDKKIYAYQHHRE